MGNLICVRVKQVDELSDVEDRRDLPAGPNGIGSVEFYEVPLHCQQSEEAALDWFHENIPIGCLDDFEIDVCPQLAEWVDKTLKQSKQVLIDDHVRRVLREYGGAYGN